MITEIGIAAGEIWRLLDEKGDRFELEEIMKRKSGDKDLALMALGWLCREGHVIITQEGEKVFVELRKC